MRTASQVMAPPQVIPNDEKRGYRLATKQALWEKMQMVAGVKRGRRVPQILVEIGDEEIDYPLESSANADGVIDVIRIPRLEAVMRVVYDLALEGDKWCINFITERMEGKAVQSMQIHSTTGDVRDMPTGALIDMISRDSNDVEAQVQERIKGLIERGVLIPNTGDVVHTESDTTQVDNS